MYKVMLLTPALYTNITKDFYKENTAKNLNTIKPDQFVIYNQCCTDSDKVDGITYIGNTDKPMGFITPRNELLKYFYNSDFDYALWLDAGDTYGNPDLNAILSLLNYLRSDNRLDVIMGTLGVKISGGRIEDKQEYDYHSNIYIHKRNNPNKGKDLLHGTIIKNFKKYYNEEYLIDNRCDPHKFLNEDLFFTKLLKNHFTIHDCFLNSVTSRPNKISTFNDNNKHNLESAAHPETNIILDNWVKEYEGMKMHHNNIEDFKIPRIPDYKEYIKDYISRKKVDPNDNKFSKKSLW